VLEPQNARAVRNAGQLYGRAQPLDETAAGRAALQQSGLARGRSPGKFISPGKKYPQPHVALPAFDKNGKEAGIWLSPLTDRDGRLEAIGGEGRIGGGRNGPVCRSAEQPQRRESAGREHGRGRQSSP
jgi:hypothetical protein